MRMTVDGGGGGMGEVDGNGYSLSGRADAMIGGDLKGELPPDMASEWER